MPGVLVALPVFNEQEHVADVLQAVQKLGSQILVVDDGSQDRTGEILRGFPNVQVVTHTENQGYGAALRSAFAYAQAHAYDVLVTIDCDGQHQPELIPTIAAELTEAIDIVSGSRYLRSFDEDSLPPEDRRRINATITQEINQRLGLSLTDAFCGFKAYRVSALAALSVTETGYAMPLQVWVQAAREGLTIQEIAVPRVYLDEERSFGGSLDDAERRLAYYRTVLDRELGVQPTSSEISSSSTPATCNREKLREPCRMS
ncbi:glycosyltransferase family 2 protein [Symmachiella macrocystis]|nr:glycosyltransferase family 2 protein [Symmachiella macrocystis]